MFHGLRANSAPVSGSISVTMTGAVRASRDSQDPFDVRGHRQTPGLAGSVLDRQPGDLHRVVHRHELEQTQEDAMGRVLEAAVALTMPGDVGRRVLPDGQRGRAPQVTGLFVPDIDGLAGRVADGIVGPRRQLDSPGCCATTCSRPRTRRPGSRSAGFATTLIQGAGVHCPSPRTVTYSRPPSTNPPSPLKNSNSGRAGGASSGDWAPRRAAAGRGGRARTRTVARASCSASVPCRLRRMARAAVCRASRSGALSRSFRRMKTLPVRLVPLVPRSPTGSSGPAPPARPGAPPCRSAPARSE